MTKFGFVTFLTVVRAPLVLLGCLCSVCNLFFPHPAWVIGMVTLLALSALTDAFDGNLARRWKVTSRLGALADPLMDKVFFLLVLPTATFIALYNELGTLHVLVLLALDIACMLRDQWVTFLRSVGSEYGADVRADWAGKLRTALGMPILILLHLHLSVLTLSRRVDTCEGWAFLPEWLLIDCEIFLLVLTLYTAGHYTRCYLPYLKRAAQPVQSGTPKS